MGVTSYLSVNDLQKVYYALNQEKPDLNKIDNITRRGRWTDFFRGMGTGQQPQLLALVKKVNQAFAQVEQKGVKIFDPNNQDASYQEKALGYRASRQIYFDVAQLITEKINELGKVSPKLKKAFYELQCREVGLRYSLGLDNGGLDALHQPDSEWLAKITDLAQAWKDKQKLAVEKELNDLEKEQLEELAKYPEWLEIASQDPNGYLSDVFNWSLRDFNQVEVLVKCYETQRKLKEALLASNLGYVRNISLTKKEDEVLAFRTVPTKVDHVAKRILTLSIYHGENFNEFEPDQQERINVLKPTEQIHFKRGNYNLSVAEFLKEIGQKNLREPNITLCADWGFKNYHPVKGVWDSDSQQYEMPEITEENWTDYVPPSRIASHEELVAQYGDEVENRDFFFKVAATRKHLAHNALDCHSFWQLYFKMEDGNWRVLNIGVYASRFPQSPLDSIWLFCSTLPRVVCTGDQNGYYTQRQRGFLPVFCDEEQQQKLLARIFYLMSSSGVFQFAGINCAHEIQKNTARSIEDVPNLFHMPLTQARAGLGFLDAILAWSHHRWDWLRSLALAFVHRLFLSSRSLQVDKGEKGKIDYSVNKYFKLNGYHIYNPSYLPYQIAEARKTGEGPFAKGELYWSHTDEKIYQKKAGLDDVLTNIEKEEEQVDSLAMMEN